MSGWIWQRETTAIVMLKLLVRYCLFWSLVLFLAPVPALGNFDSGDCTVDNSPSSGKTQCVHASASVASNQGLCLADLVSLESCETKSGTESLGSRLNHRRLQSCVGTWARLGYAAFDAQFRKAYFVTTLYVRLYVRKHAYADIKIKKIKPNKFKKCYIGGLCFSGFRIMSMHDSK